MKYPWMVVLLGIASVGCGVGGCVPRGEGDVAGVAYSENDAGELVRMEGKRTTSSTAAPVASRKPDGADAEWLTSFELTERSGATISSEELKGQPYVVSFFFSLCGSICEQQNQKVQTLQEKFAGQPIRLISITCDPAIDTPDVLAEYAKKFNADPEQWLFLTGDIQYLRRVGAEMYFLPVEVRFHAEKFVLINADGKIHGSYNWKEADQWQQLQLDMAKLIKEVETGE